MSVVGNVGSGLGTSGGAALGYRVGGLPGAIVGGAIGSFAGGYGGDRVYEAVTGNDDEREKALALLNMYLSPQDVASVDRRIEMAEGGQMQPQQDPRMERGMRPLSPQEQQVQAQMQMQEARRQQAMQSKAQQDMIRAQMMQQQGYQ
jgi:hypothetical protein